jgi:transcriptional regulator with XRE-family HTH domain
MSRKNAQSPAPQKHPLQQLRDILKWSRETCAKETGLKPATIQNIERGVAPLPEEAAFAIEAATSCNAMALAESSETWRRMKSEDAKLFAMAGHSQATSELFAPRALNGTFFTAESYECYKKATLSQKSVESAIHDLTIRLELLLGPLGSQPHRFRRMYRYLAQVLNKEKKEAAATDAEISEYALTLGRAELKEMTVEELAKIPDINESPQWKKANVLERFHPKQKVHVVLEEYPFWPSTERLGTEENYIVPDYVFGVRTVWRITQPDGKPLVIIIDNTHSTGLQGRLTDAMIQVNKERQTGKAAKG